jgi:hypothetical protein
MKTVFVAHPISGDVSQNLEKVLKICEDIHTKDLVPVAPYLVSLQYLDDGVIEDRELGVEANLECFRRGYVDELWLFGDKISSGMKKEVLLARKFNIPVVAKSPETKRDLEML